MGFHGNRSSAEKLRRSVLIWIVAIWISALLVFSLQPYRFAATSGRTPAHVIAHVFAFGVPAFLLLRARLASALILLLGIFCLAAGIEFAQSLLYRNPVEWADLLADSFGIALAALLTMLWRDHNL